MLRITRFLHANLCYQTQDDMNCLIAYKC